MRLTMFDLGAVNTRGFHKARDRRAWERLRRQGRHYVLAQPSAPEDSIVAETTMLTPTLVGYLGFVQTSTFGKLMPNLMLTQAVVDPTIGRAEQDAVFLRMLRNMYAAFDECQRGYLLTRVSMNDSDTRRLLEADGWEATAYAEGSWWVPYAWFAADRYTPAVSGT